MIIILTLRMLFIIIISLVVQRGRPMALVICLELMALLTIYLWFTYLFSGINVNIMGVSFWLIIFIILGATMALVLLSIAAATKEMQYISTSLRS